jgi:hypothetical protein
MNAMIKLPLEQLAGTDLLGQSGEESVDLVFHSRVVIKVTLASIDSDNVDIRISPTGQESLEVRSNDGWGVCPSYIATQDNPFVLVGATENGGRIDVLSHDGLLLYSIAGPALLKDLAVQLLQPLGSRLRSIN